MQWSGFRLGDRHHKLIRYSSLAIVMIALVIGFYSLPAQAVTPRHYTDLDFGPPPEVTLPDYTRFSLDNGMVVYLVEDHELPLVSGSAVFRTGDRLEAPEQVGIAAIVGEVMRSGGTATHPADELNQFLEQRAASVETGINTTSGSASFSALSEDLEEVFDVFADVIQNPAFPQEKIDLSKTQLSGSIARRNDDPDDIVGREFQKLIYGNDSPYARTIEYATLDNISRPDIVNFYQQYFKPQGTLLGLVGDFDSQVMRSLIETKFANWQTTTAASDPPSLPSVSQAYQGGVFLIDQPQLTQSYIQIGHLSGEFKDSDYPALSVLNEVMNGFGGRLMNQVRSRQGLAYVVYAYWGAQYDYPGVFVGGGQTRSEATVPFIQSVLDEIERVRTSPITDEELTRAKDSVLNSFIFSFETPGQTISRLMRYEYYGYPPDFIFQYQHAVSTTTADDIQKAAQTHLKPDQIVTLVVGNATAIDPPLSSLTPTSDVMPIDITIPAPTPS